MNQTPTELLPFTKEILNHAARLALANLGTDLDGRPYVETEAISVATLFELVAKTYPDKEGEAVLKLTLDAIDLWTIPAPNYWSPLLPKILESAIKDSTDLTLSHFMLLISNNALFASTMLACSSFDRPFSKEEVIIKTFEMIQCILDEKVEASNIISTLTTIENLGLIQTTDSKYILTPLKVDKDQLEAAFHIFNKFFFQINPQIAQELLKPFIPTT